MFSFFKRKNQKEQTPTWARFFTPEEYTQFVGEVEVYFNSKGIDINLENGVVKVNTSGFGLNNLGLLNVAQQCKQDSASEYKVIVENHFNQLKASYDESKLFDEVKGDFNQARELLALRLYNKAYVTAVGEELTVGYDFAGDLYAMLVYDLPETIESVSIDEINRWGKTKEELFEIGVQNVKRKYKQKLVQHEVSEIDIWFAEDQHFFVPNTLLDLDENRYLIGTYGAIVATPTRSTAIIYPIESVDVIQAINKLIPIVYNLNSEGPGSLSNHVFWYINNEFIDLPYSVENNKLSIEPPGSFVDMLNKLSQIEG